MNMVFKVIEIVNYDFNTNLPQIKDIEYFSEECAGSTKISKKILNPYLYHEDFGVSVK